MKLKIDEKINHSGPKLSHQEDLEMGQHVVQPEIAICGNGGRSLYLGLKKLN